MYREFDELSQFTDREKEIIEECVRYAKGSTPGLPGHNLMLIIDKMHKRIKFLEEELWECENGEFIHEKQD